MATNKIIVQQDKEFVYYTDGSKETIDTYRKSKGLKSRKELVEGNFKKYRKENQEWLRKKAIGKLKTLDDIK